MILRSSEKVWSANTLVLESLLSLYKSDGKNACRILRGSVALDSESLHIDNQPRFSLILEGSSAPAIEYTVSSKQGLPPQSSHKN